MRRFRLFLPGFIILMSFSIHAQEIHRPNVLYLEAGGAVVFGLGVGYERYFQAGSSTHWSARAGLGLIDGLTVLSPHFGGSFLWGRKGNLEIGLNMTGGNEDFKTHEDGSEMAYFSLQPLIGFRYQDWEDGFLFRIFFVPPVGAFEPDYLYIPYGGITIGFALK